MTPHDLPAVMMIAFGLVTALSVAALICHENELSRLANDLDRCDEQSNARLTLHVRSRGIERLAGAINAELDRERTRHIEDGAAHKAFQQDLAALSHDIRTPLAGAQGYLQLVERTQDTEEQARYLHAATERLDAMRVLVDGLFEYARASDPTLELDIVPISLAPVVSEVLLGLYPQFSEKGWEPRLTCDVDEQEIIVLVDTDALARVLGNLASNALRYGAGAPRIALSADDHTATIRFENPLSDPHALDADRLFERFYRSDAARAGGGSGLGLAIVAQLVKAMEGTVDASIVDNTLRIDVNLPRA